MRFYLLFLIFLSAPSLSYQNIPKAVQQAEKVVWKIYDYRITGTGFFVDRGLFATSLHVVLNHFKKNGHSLQKFKLSQNGKKTKIKFKGIHNLSFVHDLIILETDQEVSDYLTLSSETPELTDSIFVIGYPKGSFQIANNVNSNFLENEHRIISYLNTSHLAGASGSPILNEKGNLVGVAQSGNYNKLISIRSNHLKKLMKSPIDQNISIESLFKEKILEPDDIFEKYIMGILFYEDDNRKLSKKYMLNFFSLIKKAAEGDYAEAQFELGMMYYKGEGVDQDYEKAFYWYKLAAKQGDASSQYVLGVMYYKGKNIKKDLRKAFELFEQAAKQGFTPAQHDLGMMYYQGKGTDKNLEKARYWFEQAAKQNFALSKRKLQYMKVTGKCQAIFKQILPI